MQYHLYTDGACQPNPGFGGWAFIAFSETHSKKRHIRSGYQKDTTNNRMELTAVLEGLKYIKTIDDRSKVFLYSDSKYLLNGLEAWMHNWVQNDWRKKNNHTISNDDIWRQLYSISQEMTISYKHIKGHSGHPENEECDQLAIMQIKNHAKT